MKQRTVKHILYSPLYIIPILVGIFHHWAGFMFLVLPFCLSLIAFTNEWDRLGDRLNRWYQRFEK